MIVEMTEKYEKDVYDILKKEFNVSYKNNPFSNWYLYVINDELIGFINFDIMYEKSELEYIYVIQEYRKKGIASKLILAMEKKLKKYNIENITLEVNCNNQNAINLYKKFGYTKVAIRPKYYKNEDGFLMMKSW